MRRRSRGLLQFSTRFSLYTLPAPGRCRGGDAPGRGTVVYVGAEHATVECSTFGVYGSAERRGHSRVQYSLYFHILHMYMIHM